MRQLTLSFCFLLLLTSCQAQTKPADANDLAPFIQHKGDSLYKAANLPGLYVGIIDGGQRQYFSFGYANKESRQAFDSTTLFEIGSITKTFTAYIIEKVLHEKGIVHA